MFLTVAVVLLAGVSEGQLASADTENGDTGTASASLAAQTQAAEAKGVPPPEPVLGAEEPAEPAPTEPAPTEPAPTEPAPAEPAPAEPAPAEPAPAEPAPAEPVPAEPTEPAPDEPAPAEPTPDEPDPAEPPAGEPDRGDPTTEDPSATDDPPTDADSSTPGRWAGGEGGIRGLAPGRGPSSVGNRLGGIPDLSGRGNSGNEGGRGNSGNEGGRGNSGGERGDDEPAPSGGSKVEEPSEDPAAEPEPEPAPSGGPQATPAATGQPGAAPSQPNQLPVQPAPQLGSGVGALTDSGTVAPGNRRSGRARFGVAAGDAGPDGGTAAGGPAGATAGAIDGAALAAAPGAPGGAPSDDAGAGGDESGDGGARAGEGNEEGGDRGAGGEEEPNVVTETVNRIVEVVPDSLKAALAALAALSLLLGLGYLFAALRARRLARQRRELLQEVGLLQTALLPPVPDKVGALRTSVAYRPADGPGAGGDFYDVLPLPGGRVGFILGDVSGHGRGALARTAFMRYTLRAYLEAGLEPRVALQVAGRVIDDNLGGDFATVLLAVHDPETGSLTYATAGHPAPIVVGPQPHDPVTAGSSPPIGVGVRTGLRQTTVPLVPGSVACLFTDGLMEARTEDGILGRERLTELLAEIGDDANARRLIDSVAAEANVRSDDMAAVVVAPTAGATAGLFRTEQLELSARELDGPIARRFLEACGLPENEVDDAERDARLLADRFGGVVLHVVFGNRLRVEVLPRNVDSIEAASKRVSAGTAQ